MGTFQRFIGFFGGSVAVFTVLKGMDSAFYGLDERRPQRIREEALRRKVKEAERKAKQELAAMEA